MAGEVYKYLEYHGLEHYNELLNNRWRRRLKYYGDLDVSVTGFTFDKLAETEATHVGDVYHLVSVTNPDVSAVSAGTEQYMVGDMIVLTNAVAAGGTGVTVERLAASGGLVWTEDITTVTQKNTKKLYIEVKSVATFSKIRRLYNITHDFVIDSATGQIWNSMDKDGNVLGRIVYTSKNYSVLQYLFTPGDDTKFEVVADGKMIRLDYFDLMLTFNLYSWTGKKFVLLNDAGGIVWTEDITTVTDPTEKKLYIEKKTDATTGVDTYIAYVYDKAKAEYIKIGTTYEDEAIDIDYMFDTTLTEKYAGDDEKSVSSEYLDTVLKDYTRYVSPFYNVEYVTYDDKAALDAVDLSALDANKVVIATVTQDETKPKGTTPETYYRTQYMIVCVEPNADGVPARKIDYMGIVDDATEHPFEIVTEIPDMTVTANQPTEDKMYWLVADQMDGTTVKYHAGLYRYDFASKDIVRPYEDSAIDIAYMFDNTLTETYGGDQDRFVDSEYLDKTLKDYTRFVAPFYDVEYQTYDTKADLDAVDLTTLDDNKVYIMTVTEDETYPRGTVPQSYDKTQYMVVAVKADAAGVPTRKLDYMGKLQDTGIEILRLV